MVGKVGNTQSQETMEDTPTLDLNKSKNVKDKKHKENYKKEQDKNHNTEKLNKTENEPKTCLICFDDLNSEVPKNKKCVTYCGHAYHTECLMESKKFTKDKSKCPYCRQYIDKKNFLASECKNKYHINDEVYAKSAKYKEERKGVITRKTNYYLWVYFPDGKTQRFINYNVRLVSEKGEKGEKGEKDSKIS